MSWSIITCPPEASHWRVEPREVAALLETEWPGARISWEDDPQYSSAFGFMLTMTCGSVYGTFSRSGDTLAAERGDIRDIAELMVWFRRLAPDSQPLVAWSGSGESCALTPGMSASDFLRDFR